MTRKVIGRGKRSKTLSEVKEVKNISKNLQSFLQISPEQKEDLPSHKLRDHAYHAYAIFLDYRKIISHREIARIN